MTDFQTQESYFPWIDICYVPEFGTYHNVVAQNSEMWNNVTAFKIEFDDMYVWIRRDQVKTSIGNNHENH